MTENNFARDSSPSFKIRLRPVEHSVNFFHCVGAHFFFNKAQSFFITSKLLVDFSHNFLVRNPTSRRNVSLRPVKHSVDFLHSIGSKKIFS